MRQIIGNTITAVIILAAWQLLGGNVIPLYVISRPSDIATRLVELAVTGDLWLDTYITLVETFFGFVIGVSLGLFLALLIFRVKFLAEFLEPLIYAINAIPRIAVAPLFIIWLGIGMGSKIGIGASMAFFLVFVTTYSGLQSIDDGLVNYSRLLGAKEQTILKEIIFPSISPHVMSGLKIAVPQTIIGVVVGEYIAAFRGLGWFIRRSASLFDAASLFVGIIVLLVIVLVFTGIVNVVEKRLNRWRTGSLTRAEHAT